jgi:hypothetical protein
MIFKFGNDPGSGHIDIEAKNLDTALKIFKVKVLWPEKYIKSDTQKVFNRDYNDAGEYLPVDIPNDAYIPVFSYDSEEEEKAYEERKKSDKKRTYKFWHEKKPVYKLPFLESITVDYNEMIDTKYLPLQEAVGDESRAIVESREMTQASGNKLAAREWENRMGRLQKELERKKENLELEISKFREIIKGKLKTLYAIETYLGVYEEIEQIACGEAASPDEPITVYQQKCYMDEEVGLTELNDYRFKDGLDYKDIHEFDTWIKKRFKRYLYKPKSIMAWQVRRTKKEYGDSFKNMENIYNFETYFLLRNGDNLYRIFSDVSTPDTMFPTKNKIEEAFKQDKAWKKDGKEVKEFYERYMYIFVMLQGLVDRTEVFGTNFAGKIDFINPLNFDKNYIELVRDAEPETWISDGRPTWEEYKTMNEKGITVGSRVLINHTWSQYRENPKGNINGEVFIVEDYKESEKKPQCRREIELIPPVASLVKKYYPGGKEASKSAGKEFEKELKKLDRELEVDKWGDILYKNTILNYEPGRNGLGCDLKRADVIFKNQLKRLKKEVESNEHDEYKIYYRNTDWVYEGWSDYSGHTRKNRIGYWARPGELINVDTVTLEEIGYYLNNRLYRESYLDVIGFMKRVYMFKKREYNEETPFVKLVMGKTGCDDEQKVRELLTWWKIKNKWKRHLSVDDAKAYRMICRKLTDTRVNIHAE